MTDPRSVLLLIGVAGLVGLGLVVVDVLNVGMAAAWRGDTETVGAAILVLMLVVIASILGGVIGGNQ